MAKPWFIPPKVYKEEIDNICTHFGCGKKLSLIESMCGDKCLEHQGKKTKVVIIKSK